MKRLIACAPWIFILIWSSGFVVAKYGFAEADSIYFLAIRLLLATLILYILTIALRQPRTLSRSDIWASLAIGLSLHGLYLGGVWYAIELGAPAGLSSVITSLQPILVSVIAVRLLAEPLHNRAVIGLATGFLGVILVVLPKLSQSDGFTFESLGFLFLALTGSTVATLLQKRIGHSIPLMIGTTYQFGIAALLFLGISIARGRTRFDLSPSSILTMFWAVMVTSIAAILLLLWLINKGSAARVSSLLYLVPPMAVLQAYLLFGEKITLIGAAGIVLTAAGVALIMST